MLRDLVINWITASNFQQTENKAEINEKFESFKKQTKDKSVNFQYFRTVCKNYWNGAYKAKTNVSSNLEEAIAPKVEISEIDLKIWKPGGENFENSLFETYKTNTGVDVILSSVGGVTKATSYIVIGEPGVGKSTILAYLQYCLQNNYKNLKIACVQSEMKRFDLGYEFMQNKMAWMGDVNYIILKDYGYNNCKTVLEKIFTDGYDILFIDSIEDIVGKLKIYAGMSQSEAENFILELMDNANDAKNNKGVNTTCFAIQQVTKGGEFKGDNKLKHMTTGMLEARKDKKGNRYLSFSKNRRCGQFVDKRLYYSLNEEKHVVYDLQTFNEEIEQEKTLKEHKAQLRAGTAAFFETIKPISDSEEKTLPISVEDAIAMAEAMNRKERLDALAGVPTEYLEEDFED